MIPSARKDCPGFYFEKSNWIRELNWGLWGWKVDRRLPAYRNNCEAAAGVCEWVMFKDIFLFTFFLGELRTNSRKKGENTMDFCAWPTRTSSNHHYPLLSVGEHLLLSLQWLCEKLLKYKNCLLTWMNLFIDCFFMQCWNNVYFYTWLVKILSDLVSWLVS